MTSPPRSLCRVARPPSRCAVLVGAVLLGGAVGAASGAAPRAARAQGVGAPRRLPYDQILSATPLFLPLGNFSAEYERTLGVRGLTAAVSGTYNTTTQLYPRRDRWASVRLMYYPSGVALDGFAVGVTVGAHRAERKYREDPTAVLAHDGGPTLGAMATYNYFFGPRRRLFFGPGFGVKRVLKSVAINSPLSSTYYEARAAVGIAF